MSSTIQVRVDNKIKKNADKTFKNMGLDMSSGIKLFLHQVIMSGSLPFQVRTANGFTVEQEQNMIKETRHALKNGKSYTSINDLHNDILNSK
ncbi:MAG: type II toxin-antitoxin system RelB/DinJ family antitoxin [bacterium]|nr:type II toxin-antitoxin system RelB/DinJ family antitoxin [bacterium]